MKLNQLEDPSTTADRKAWLRANFNVLSGLESGLEKLLAHLVQGQREHALAELNSLSKRVNALKRTIVSYPE